MTDRPNVSVKPLGKSQYAVSYTMYSPDQKPTDVQATVKSSSVLEFTATAGSTKFHDESQAIPGGIRVKSQKTNGNTHVVTVECPTDPTQYLE